MTRLLRLILVVLLAALAALAVMGFRLHQAQLALQDAALRADSVEAANDRQRALFVRGLEVQARRIVQLALDRDSLDRDLKLESRARYRLGLQVRDLTAQLTAPVTEDSADTRHASFHVRTEPYTVEAEVALPAPPAEGTLGLRVALDSIELRARVGCGEATAGVRPATFLLEGPTWARLSLLELAQDPAVCNAKAGLPTPWWWRPPLWVTGAVAGLSYILGRVF